jgi:hypothetical protein
VEGQKVPEANIKIPQGQDNPWKDTMVRFDGKWMPDIDGSLIGPQNYQILENLRYKDSGLEGVNGYTKRNTTALTDFTMIRTGHQLRTNKTQDSYVLVHAVDSGEQGRVYVNRSTPGEQGDFDDSHKFDTDGNPYFEDASSGLTGRFSAAPQGNMGYCNGEESMIFGGDEQRVAACFTCTNSALALPVDETKSANNTLTTDAFEVKFGTRPALLVMTTRPIQALRLYVSSPNVSAATMTVKTWTGAAFSADILDVDGTSTDSKTLAKTGTVTLDDHTDSTSKLKHFEELYLYAYLIEIDAGDADVYHITVDPAMQSVKDVWDGVYRQPIQFQVLDDTVYYDYTLQANESSDVNAPVGAELDGNGTNATDRVYIMFEDQASAIRFTMLADKINDNAAIMTMKYWNGDAYAAVTITDGTIGATGKTCSQSGLISWTPPSDEVARTLFGSYGYVYEIDFNAALAADVIVDICTGVPHQLTVQAFDFSSIYGTRMMLGGFSQGDEGNRMDYSVANAPDAWNGFDASDNAKQSLYFGGVENIVGSAQVYNRFGASVYAMLLVLKKNETYILVGDTPEDFIIYDVAKTVGCVAPLSIATAEVGLDLGNGLTRNVAIWLSHSGPMMFDGAILTPIPGIRSYFDPNNAQYIDFELISKAVGWVDPNYKEYNLLIPSGSTELNNVWLVYDLLRRKWFTKKTGQAAFPQTGFEIGEPHTGQRWVYSGIDTGYMIQLENGTYWDDGSAMGITQTVRTGDFFPSQNIWDETTIRKFKIFIRRLSGSSVTNTLQVNYYTDTDLSSGSGVIFEDGNPASGVYVSWADIPNVLEWTSDTAATVDLDLDVGLQRLIRVIQDLNRTGWAHAFEFTVTTTDINKGFQPILWGTQYRVERKDNASST